MFHCKWEDEGIVCVHSLNFSNPHMYLQNIIQMSEQIKSHFFHDFDHIYVLLDYS